MVTEILKAQHQTDSIHAFGKEKVPVIAPAWLPALLKISVQILFAPEGRKTPQPMNDHEGGDNSLDWQNWNNSPAVSRGKKIFTFCSCSESP